jgi:hypothetical protein
VGVRRMSQIKRWWEKFWKTYLEAEKIVEDQYEQDKMETKDFIRHWWFELMLLGLVIIIYVILMLNNSGLI